MTKKRCIVPKTCETLADIVAFVDGKVARDDDTSWLFDLYHHKLEHKEYYILVKKCFNEDRADFLLPLRAMIGIIFPEPAVVPPGDVVDLTDIADSPIASKSPDSFSPKGDVDPRENDIADPSVEKKDDSVEEAAKDDAKEDAKEDAKSKAVASKPRIAFVEDEDLFKDVYQKKNLRSSDEYNQSSKRSSFGSNLSEAVVVDDYLDDDFAETQPDPYGVDN